MLFALYLSVTPHNKIIGSGLDALSTDESLIGLALAAETKEIMHNYKFAWHYRKIYNMWE
jgi:hypothetical protein